MFPKSSVQEYSLAEIARLVNGRLEGPGEVLVKGLCALEEPVPCCLAFARYTSVKRILSYDLSSLAGLIVREDLSASGELRDIGLIRVANPQKAMLQLVPLFFTPPEIERGISPRADIHSRARIGRNVTIGSFCSVGAEAQIGDNTVIYPQVTIYHGAVIGTGAVIHAGAVIREFCRVGNNAVIQPGAVVGADGFGYIPDPQRGLVAVPQIGIAVLEDEVELGANACVDRATLGTTRIGQCSKLDNHVQIGHNTTVGRYSIICGHAALAGSCRIGNQVVIGGNTGIADHIVIADGVRVAGQAGVSGDLTEKGDYAGYPILPAETWRKRFALLSYLLKHSKVLRKLLKSEGEA